MVKRVRPKFVYQPRDQKTIAARAGVIYRKPKKKKRVLKEFTYKVDRHKQWQRKWRHVIDTTGYLFVVDLAECDHTDWHGMVTLYRGLFLNALLDTEPELEQCLFELLQVEWLDEGMVLSAGIYHLLDSRARIEYGKNELSRAEPLV